MKSCSSESVNKHRVLFECVTRGEGPGLGKKKVFRMGEMVTYITKGVQEKTEMAVHAIISDDIVH